MWMRMPAKHEAGAEVALATVQGAPAAPSAANPWSSVIWLDGIDPFGPATNWPTKSVFQGALVASRLYSPVPSWKLDLLKAERNTSPFAKPLVGAHPTPMRGRKFAIPLYWL